MSTRERDWRTLPTAVGTGLSTLILAVGLSLIAAPRLLGVGSGLQGTIVSSAVAVIALAVGTAAGLAFGFRVADGFAEWSPSIQRTVSGYAAFGLVFSLAYPLSLVAPGRIEPFVTIETVIGVSLVVAAVAHGFEYAQSAS